MSLPTSICAPRRWSSSRLRACASVSPVSTFPPGNSHKSGSTAAGRRCVIRYFPSFSMTAATTRMVRPVIGSHRDAEELLTHEQHVAALHRRLFAETDEGAVRASEIGQRDATAVVRDVAVEAGDVAVFGEEHVAALATDVDAGLGNRERVASRLAADDERDAPDVALAGRAEALDAVRRRGE